MTPLLGHLDYPDPDVIRVGDTYYLISTTMHFMPGGEILRSYDLVNWEWVAFVYNTLEDNPAHRLEDGQNIYGKGMWAATLRHHEGLFYALFVANDTGKTYLFRSETITGPWRRSEVRGFYHDASLLFDQGRVFLAWGNTEIRITELDPDFSGPLEGGLDRVAVREVGNRKLGYEGAHFYRIGGRYYLFFIHSRPFRWRRVQACFWAESLEGEFQGGDVLDDDLGYGENGVAQGGIVDTPDGRWYALLFQDKGAVGRLPVLVEVTWDGPQPVFGTEGRVGTPTPPASTRPGHVYRPLVGDDDFGGPLAPWWQWNHNPDPEGFRLEAGQLKLRARRTAPHLLAAQNTLTQRTCFPGGAAEVTVDGSNLKVGDTAGLVALQSAFGAVALTRTDRGWEIVVLRDAVEARLPIEGPRARLRLEVTYSAGYDGATFWFEGTNLWHRIGPAHPLFFRLDHFVGARFGLFLWAAREAGGEAGFSQFRHRVGSG